MISWRGDRGCTKSIPQSPTCDILGCVWERRQIREILSNKRSHLKKHTYDDRENREVGGYPMEKPATAHKHEWNEAKK